MGVQIYDIEVTRGNTYKRKLYFKDNGSILPITGWKVLFTVKEKISDTDGVTGSTALIEKSITSHTDAAGGLTTLSLTTTDTDKTPGNYIYDIKIITTDSVDELTIVEGAFTILQGVTLRDS